MSLDKRLAKLEQLVPARVARRTVRPVPTESFWAFARALLRGEFGAEDIDRTDYSQMNLRTRDLVTTKTAAERLGVSKARIDQFARGGKLFPVEIDGVRFFRRSEVLAFARQPRPEGRPPKSPRPSSGCTPWRGISRRCSRPSCSSARSEHPLPE